jgi:hypothetical protein
MATLSDLPEELLVRVLGHLAYPTAVDISTSDERERASYVDNFAAIRSACAVSKLFHRLAWPILYTALPPALGPCFAGRLRGALYLRTLVSRPEYRGVLQYVAIDLRLPHQKMRQKQSLKPGDREEVEVAIRREVVDLYSGWESGRDSLSTTVQRVEALFEESAMGLIPLLCPNISRVDVYTDRGRGFKVQLLTEMLEIGAAVRQTDASIAGVLESIRPRILEKLRAVNLRTISVGDWNAFFVTNVLRLPALEELFIDGVKNMYQPFLQSSDLTFPRISTLRLLFCNGLP